MEVGNWETGKQCSKHDVLCSKDIDKPHKMIYNAPIRSYGLKYTVKEVKANEKRT